MKSDRPAQKLMSSSCSFHLSIHALTLVEEEQKPYLAKEGEDSASIYSYLAIRIDSAAILLDVLYLYWEPIIIDLAKTAALSFTNWGKGVIKSVWWMNSRGDSYPRSKLSRFSRVPSSFNIDYLVTL